MSVVMEDLLPPEVLRRIAELLHGVDRLSFMLTCKTAREALVAPSLAVETNLRRLARDARAPELTMDWYRFAFRTGENDLDGRCGFTSLAASQGNVEALSWLRLKGCPFADEAADLAARGGHLEVLQYLRGKGCCSAGAYEEACKGYAERSPRDLEEEDSTAFRYLGVMRWAKEQEVRGRGLEFCGGASVKEVPPRQRHGMAHSHRLIPYCSDEIL
ncbi:F-box domain-containing protein [Chloropicon primus]|nr:hypothetical protein A3770_10p57800 [Chloropicon primus]UPR02474.1 F-box domain-containing protein [Chloropicon primus]|eukprot:QDZ23262.1 hypothetical protein A3770_10p57800 [Chloropicon primus]